MPNAPDDYSVSISGLHLTAAAAAAGSLTILNRQRAEGGGSIVLIKSTPTAAPPANWRGALELAPGDGHIETTIAKLWPGVTDTYLHCRTLTGDAVVSFTSA